MAGGGVTFRVTGGNRAHAIAKQLKALDDKKLTSELRKGMSRAVKPGMNAVKTSTPEYFPNRYAPIIASALQLRTANQAAGLRITATAKGAGEPRRITAMNSGTLRHPLWGNRGHWYATRIKPGFFDEPLTRQAPAIRAELDKVLDQVAAKIAAG